MNAIHPTPKPCRTVEEWLASHKATQCPARYALGISEMELRCGKVATDGDSWVNIIRKTVSKDVSAKRSLKVQLGKALAKTRKMSK